MSPVLKLRDGDPLENSGFNLLRVSTRDRAKVRAESSQV